MIAEGFVDGALVFCHHYCFGFSLDSLGSSTSVAFGVLKGFVERLLDLTGCAVDSAFDAALLSLGVGVFFVACGSTDAG